MAAIGRSPCTSSSSSRVPAYTVAGCAMRPGLPLPHSARHQQPGPAAIEDRLRGGLPDERFRTGRVDLRLIRARLSHCSFRAAQCDADCPGVLPPPCPLSLDRSDHHARPFGMEPVLPYCSLLQTNLSPCPCPCGTGAAQQQFSPSVPPTQQAVWGPRENAFLALAALQNYQAPEEGVLPSAGQR